MEDARAKAERDKYRAMMEAMLRAQGPPLPKPAGHNGQLEFDLIVSFDRSPQIVNQTILIPPRGTEKDFITAILNDVVPANQLRELVKISTAFQMYEGDVREPWFDERSYHHQGKYFFNADVNPDPDTKMWAKFLVDHCEARGL
jgi:hypothetical protein